MAKAKAAVSDKTNVFPGSLTVTAKNFTAMTRRNWQAKTRCKGTVVTGRPKNKLPRRQISYRFLVAVSNFTGRVAVHSEEPWLCWLCAWVGVGDNI